MNTRNIILLAAMAAELILFLYCLLRKSNHVPAGYICALLSLILFIQIPQDLKLMLMMGVIVNYLFPFGILRNTKKQRAVLW